MKRKLIGLGLLAAVAASLLTLAPASAEEKRIQLRMELYKGVKADWSRKVIPQFRPGSSLIVSGDTLTAAREALTKSGAVLSASPSISMLDNTDAECHVKPEMSSPENEGKEPSGSIDMIFTIRAHVKANGDSAITLAINAELPYIEKVITVIGSQIITNDIVRHVNAKVTQRLNVGESLLWSTATLPTKEQIAIVFTPVFVD